MSGADLANTVNEAALLAARLNKSKVDMEDFEEAKDKVRLGPERKSRVMKEDSRRVSAYHEAGHAVVGSYLENADPLHKVTIIPRGRAGGLTYFLPDDDRLFYSREYLLDLVSMSLGGRAAEELILGRVGSGAQNDIKNASTIVRKMVTQWGMSEKLGPICFGDHEEQIFLGRELATRKDYSEQTAIEIDKEVRKIILECQKKAKTILIEHMDQLHKVAEALLERESLDAEDVKILLNNGTLPPRKKNIHAETERTDAKETGGRAADRSAEDLPGREEAVGDDPDTDDREEDDSTAGSSKAGEPDAEDKTS
jgi:cell division protease FtsH